MRRLKAILILFLGISLWLSMNPLKAKAIGYGIGYNTNHERPSPGKDIENILGKDNVYIGPEENKIYLTFDMGYENGYTRDILDTLHKYNIPATFFITGHYVKSEPELVKRMVEDGHILGNHSNHHSDFTKISNEKIKEELVSLEMLVKDNTGYEVSHFIRPPEGRFSEESIAFTNQLGYKNIFWSVAYVDWYIDRQNGYDKAYKILTSRVHPGAIYLLHAVSKDNRDVLEGFILKMQEEGYQFGSLYDFIS